MPVLDCEKRDPFGSTRSQRRAMREVERENYRKLSRLLRMRDEALEPSPEVKRLRREQERKLARLMRTRRRIESGAGRGR